MVIIPSSIGLIFEPDKTNFIRFKNVFISMTENEDYSYSAITYVERYFGKSVFSNKLVMRNNNNKFIYCFEEQINNFKHMFRLEQDKIFREKWQSLFPNQFI